MPGLREIKKPPEIVSLGRHVVRGQREKARDVIGFCHGPSLAHGARPPQGPVAMRQAAMQ